MYSKSKPLKAQQGNQGPEPNRRLFSSHLTATLLGRASVVPYSPKALNDYAASALKTPSTKTLHASTKGPFVYQFEAPIKRPDTASRSPLRSVNLRHRQHKLQHEVSNRAIIHQDTAKQIPPASVSQQLIGTAKIRHYNIFTAHARGVQIVHPEHAPNAIRQASEHQQEQENGHKDEDGSEQARSADMQDAFCSVIAANYRHCRVQNAALLFLERGSFALRNINYDLRYYKHAHKKLRFQEEHADGIGEDSLASMYCSTFSEINSNNALMNLFLSASNEKPTEGAPWRSFARECIRRLSRLSKAGVSIGSSSEIAQQYRSHLALDVGQKNTDSRATNVAFSLESSVRQLSSSNQQSSPEVTDSVEHSNSDSDSSLHVMLVSTTMGLIRTHSLPSSSAAHGTHNKDTFRHSFMRGSSVLIAPVSQCTKPPDQPNKPKHLSSIVLAVPDKEHDIAMQEAELRCVARNARLRRIHSCIAVTTSRGSKRKVTHFIPSFGYLKPETYQDSFSILSEINECDNINDKLDRIEQMKRLVSNKRQVSAHFRNPDIEEVQSTLDMLYGRRPKSNRGKPSSRIKRRSNNPDDIDYDLYARQTGEQQGTDEDSEDIDGTQELRGLQTNDVAMIEALYTCTSRPVQHTYGVSRSIIACCNAILHECRMGTIFETLSLGRNFLYIVEFHMDMDIYFPQILAFVLQERLGTASQKTLSDQPPACVLPTDNIVINKTEMPILTIYSIFLELAHNNLMRRATSILNSCVSKRFFDLYMMLTIQAFSETFSDLNIWGRPLSWELAMKVCNRILVANKNSQADVAWIPYGDVPYLISLVVITGRCAGGIFDSADTGESMLYSLILNYSIYDVFSTILHAFRKNERHISDMPYIGKDSASCLSGSYDNHRWQTGSFFEILTIELPIQYVQYYSEADPSLDQTYEMFGWLSGLQIVTDFRLFESIGLLIQMSHVDLLLTNMRRVKFLLVLLTELLRGYVLSAAGKPKPDEYGAISAQKQQQSGTTGTLSTVAVDNPFLISNILYAIGSILAVLLDKRLVQKNFKTDILSDRAANLPADIREGVYELVSLQTYATRTVLLLIGNLLSDIDVDMESDLDKYRLASLYTSPYHDLHGLVPPYILFHDSTAIYKNIDFRVKSKDNEFQHIFFKHYCASFIMRMIRSVIAFSSISDLNSLLIMRSCVCLALFRALENQPRAFKYTITQWYIVRFLQMTDRKG